MALYLWNVSNLVPIPFFLSPYTSFEACLQQVKKITLESFGIFQLPFYYLLEHFKLHTTSLFRSLFVFQQAYPIF